MRPLLATLLLTALLAACRTTSDPRLAALPEYVQPRPVAMKVPYPIILLHGLGQKADAWNAEATNYFSNDLGLRSGGVLHVQQGTITSSLAGAADADFYVMSFRNPHDSIAAWASELTTAVDWVRSRTGADRVILIGYSMGGLAARTYLTRRLTDHHVKRLVTVGTPHLGSPYARIWSWKTSMQRCVAEGNILVQAPCKAALAAIQGTEGDVPYDAPAVRDLRRPEDGGTFLRNLGKYAHPLDVEYVSVIGTVDMLNEVQALSEGWIQEVMRKALSVSGGGLTDLFEAGDGVVSARSQDIMNVEFFRIDPARRRTSRTVNLPSVHLDHLRRSIDIQRTALDEKPEFKGADFVRQGDTAYVVVDVTDHIPMLCRLQVEAVTDDGRTISFATPAGSTRMVRTPDGLVARFLVPLRDGAGTVIPRRVKGTITNTFGQTATFSRDRR